MPILRAILDQLRGTWRFRWTAMATAWVISLLALVLILALPETFRASSTVLVDARTELGAATADLTVDSGVDAQIQRVSQSLFGVPRLELIAKRSGLVPEDADPTTLAAAVAQLQSGIELTDQAFGRSGSSGMYMISFTDQSAETSIAVVETLIQTFVEETQTGKLAGSNEAQQFLSQQTIETEARLRAAEERLADFKKKNVALMPGAQGDYFARLQAETDQLDIAQSNLAVASQRHSELQRQLRGELPLVPGGVGEAGAASGIGTGETGMRIAQAQRQLDELLLRYTERHPDVTELRSTIRELEQRQAQEIEAARSGDARAVARSGLSASPVYQSLQVQYNQVGVEVAALRAEVNQRQNRIASLRSLINTAPEIEAEFTRLDRDYGAVKAQYDALVGQLGRAQLGGEAVRSGIVKFEVVEPAYAEPVLPRSLLAIGALVFALLAGLAGAWVKNMLHPVFRSMRQLQAASDLPVLGSVSMTWIDRYDARMRRQSIMVGVATVALLAVYGYFMVAQQSLAASIQSLLS